MSTFSPVSSPSPSLPASTSATSYISSDGGGPSNTAPSSTQVSPPHAVIVSENQDGRPDMPPFLAKIRAHLLSHPPSPTTPAVSGPTTLKPLYLPPPSVPQVEEDLVPPENFACVSKGVYRSGFPLKRNFKFMETLQLKTVLTLVLEDYPEANLKWCQSQDIQFLQFGIPGNKEPFDNIPEEVIRAALVTVLDRRNHPILIHCNKGKHRTGCLIGCIRRTQSWSLTSIFDEYRRFSAPKSRAVDQQFIDLFEVDKVWDEVVEKGGGLDYLPDWKMLTVPRGVYTKSKTQTSQNVLVQPP